MVPSLPNLQQGWLGQSPRWLRLSLTFSLCLPGAAFLLATEWAEDEATPLSRLLRLLVRVVIVHPLFDYWGHRLLHKTGNMQHHMHHVAAGIMLRASSAQINSRERLRCWRRFRIWSGRAAS